MPMFSLQVTRWTVVAARALARDFRRADGQTMAEYGLILAGIFVLVAATILLLGPQISSAFANVKNQFP
jgi:Flp pilus assembly pilin Flp